MAKAAKKTLSLTKEQLLQAYRSLKTIREFEERIHTEVNNGRLAGFYHLSSGQEGNAVGVCAHLHGDDSIITTHRGHGHCIARGADVTAMMKELWGSSEGLCKGRGGTMHIADVEKGILGANGIVGGGPPISVGAALANKMRENDAVAVSFSGDGSVNEGAVFEAMNLAVVLKVPAVFVIEDNYYGEFTGAGYANGCEDLKARTEGFGFPVFEVDGSDFFAVYEAAGRAIEHARSGKGPAGLICKAGRFHGHYTGDPEDYRELGEVANLRENFDPLKKFRETAQASGDLNETDMEQIDNDVALLIDRAVEASLMAPRPDASQVADDVYVSY